MSAIYIPSNGNHHRGAALDKVANRRPDSRHGKSIAILGGRGMLGSDLAPALAAAGHQVHAWDLPECDITRTAQMEKALDGAEIVVNCAAFTNVDGAEDHPESAEAVNARAVAHLAAAARRRNMLVVHISTDFVFDGQGTRPWREDDPPRPLSVYGRTKIAGEQALRQSGCQYLTMRVQWSYGGHGANFIAKILERARAGAPLKIVDDQVGAPTWTRDMSRAIVQLLDRQCTGLYHFANAGYSSRFDVARFVMDHCKLPNPLIPCRTGEFPARAARPLNSRFELSRIQAVLDYPIRSWQEALAEYLDEQISK